jgi:beta-glucanase (GH16 family)
MITRDDFDGASLDRSLWATPDHPLGHGYVRGENVSVADGRLYLKIPANSLDGAEIKSARGDYQYGSYTVRMKAPPASDTYLAPFLWAEPNFHSEIDIEVHNDSSRTTFFNTYEGPKIDPPDTIQQEVVTLPFDPSAGFHDYRFDYTPDSVKFYVDGVHYWTVAKRIPPSPMFFLVNAHWPEYFQDPRKVDRDLYAEVEYVEVRSLPNTD